MYVFVNDARGKQPEFVVALSKYVSGKVEYQKARNGSEWFSFNKQDRPMAEEGWEQFGNARGDAEIPLVLTPDTKTVEIPDPSTE